jgi:hypothetical protein
MNNTIEFTEAAVKDYLDSTISFWRGKINTDFKAIYYVDAFQSVRASLFGKILGEVDEVPNIDVTEWLPWRNTGLPRK